MKSSARTRWTWIVICAASCFVFSACSKKISPQVARQSRLDWNLKTTVAAYLQIGSTDPNWDEVATNALAEFALSRSDLMPPGEDWTGIIRQNCNTAVKAGCDDPMVRYLYIRFCMSQTNSREAFAAAFSKMQDDMEQSSYPPIRKFYASWRTLDQIYYTDGTNADGKETSQLADDLVEDLTQTLGDKTTPPEEVYEACNEGLYELSGGKTRYENCYHQIEPLLFQNWPDESISWLLKGTAYTQMAWFARSNGYANTVTDDQWKSFREKLAVAEESLNKAWKLNPKDKRIPYEMMTLELGQGKGRDRMELWFNRAMALDSNDYDACNSKLLYLEPKWYGSVEEMLNFGRFCVENTNWGGRIPIVLVNAHLNIAEQYTDKSEQADYWKRPEVWADIQSAYDRCFQINPNATDLYYYYARFAYRAEDWPKLNELIPKLGAPINYNFFGGKDEFDKMVQLAKEHAGKTAGASSQ